MSVRRILAASALAAALFAASACSGDGDGDGGAGDPTAASTPTPSTGGGGTLTNQEICAEGEELLGDYEAAGAGLLTALGSGDEATIEQAAGVLAAESSRISDEARDLAEQAEDPEFAAAIGTFATELEDLTETVTADPESLTSLDTTGLEDAIAEIEQTCG